MKPKLRCTDVVRAGNSPGSDRAADTITLDETARHRRRLLMKSDHGIEFLLDLADTTVLRTGDRLPLDDGREISVLAAEEALYEIHALDPPHLLRLAWHLGNRHLATEIHPDHLRIRADPVIGSMIEQLGGRVVSTTASFDPEGGAYGSHAGARAASAQAHTLGHSHASGDGRRHGS